MMIKANDVFELSRWSSEMNLSMFDYNLFSEAKKSITNEHIRYSI